MRPVFRMLSRAIGFGLFFMVCVPCCPNVNIALKKPTAQSSDHSGMGVSSHAVDGDSDPHYFNSHCTHTADDLVNPWWTVDLLDVYNIRQIFLYNRNEGKSRLDNVTVEGFLGDPFVCTNGVLCAFNPGPSKDVVTLNCPDETRARYVKLSKNKPVLTLCEVQIFRDMVSYREAVGPQFSPLCYHRKTERIGGQKLTSSVILGSAQTRLDCLHLCQRRPNCSIFNYNDITLTCSTSASLMKDGDITPEKDWDLYALC